MAELCWQFKKTVQGYVSNIPVSTIRHIKSLSSKVSKNGISHQMDGNMVIHGDNILAMQAILPYYRERIKIIYIDPPYNRCSNIQAYDDNMNSATTKAWLKDVLGVSHKRSLPNHDLWLSMMYPRLKLLWSMLRSDGVIFISIDSSEYHYLKLLMDEIFGEENFITDIIWHNKGGGAADSKKIIKEHEYILMYGKDISKVKLNFLEIPKFVVDRYRFKDEFFHERGPYTVKELHQASIKDNANLHYDITAPDNTIISGKDKIWRWTEPLFLRNKEAGRVIIKKRKDEWKVYTKQYLYEDKDGNKIERKRPYSSMITDLVKTRRGREELKKFFNSKSPFEYPKPIELIKYLVKMVSTPDEKEIILDCFAGSGTTARATLSLNQEDGGDRSFILIESEKETTEKVILPVLEKIRKGYSYQTKKDLFKFPAVEFHYNYFRVGTTIYQNGKFKNNSSHIIRFIRFYKTGIYNQYEKTTQDVSYSIQGKQLNFNYQGNSGVINFQNFL